MGDFAKCGRKGDEDSLGFILTELKTLIKDP